jgi:putative ABC transport system permease protein
MKNVLRDVRFGLRMFRKNAWFTAAAVTVLALGIGANTSIFTLVDAFLLKPLVIRNPSEIVGCYSRNVRSGDYRGFSYSDYAALREDHAAFSSLAAHNMAMVGLAEGDTTRRAFADIVSSNYFDTFGVPLFRGRGFTAQEERPGAAIPVVIVSYPYWKSHGADAQLLGAKLRTNSRDYTVIGVAPEGFTGTTALISSEFYFPLGVYDLVQNDFDEGRRQLALRSTHDLLLIGRLKHGITEKSADALLATTASQLASAYPVDDKDQTFLVRPMGRLGISTNPTDDSGILVPAALLLGVAGVVLLIASLNVANMMLARGTTRAKEIAVRLALGGSRWDIVRQLLIEGFVLALAGGAAGLAVAYWGTEALVKSMAHLAPIELAFSGRPDVTVLLATVGFCLLSTIIFALGPAWNLSKWNLLAGLKTGDRAEISTGGGRGISSRRNLLVLGQIALSLMLLTAAGLFIESSMRSAGVRPGFRIQGEAVAEVDASLAGYNEARGREIYRATIERLRTVPGVEDVSLAATLPFGMISLGKTVQPAGDTARTSGRRADCQYNIVSADYFRTMGIPLLRGRAFTTQDAAKTTRPVAILDESAAKKLWPAGDAVGKDVRIASSASDDHAVIAEVVGVVANMQEHVFEPQWPPHIFVPFSQAYQSDVNFELKTTALDAASQALLLQSVRGAIREVDPQLPVLSLKTMRMHMDSSFDLWVVRTGARMFMIFGGVALLLAAIGLYGVRAYAVAMRTREIGIRMALGARASDALRLILGEGMALLAIGAAAGLVLSAVIGKLLAGLLYGVKGFDPVVLLAAPCVLAIVSLVACYVPARRAARLDPMAALRDE